MESASAKAQPPESSQEEGGYSLPSIPYVRLRFTLRAQEEAWLPAFTGSLLRGAFGHALRKAVCAMGPGQACETCRLRSACVYTRLFETFVEGEPPPFLHGLATAPRPFVLEPGEGSGRLGKGDGLSFDLLLVGRAVELLDYAVLAVERMAAGGLGRSRRRFGLEDVRHLDRDGAWRSGLGSEASDMRGVREVMATPAPERVSRERINLRFLTPTRIRVKGHLSGGPGFRELAFAMLRRTLELAYFYVPGADVDWSFHELLELAGRVRVVGANLRWHDWRRYSNRQQTSMTLGGFVGDLQLEGDLGPFLPLLEAATVLHVGKGTTFGLGRVATDCTGATGAWVPKAEGRALGQEQHKGLERPWTVGERSPRLGPPRGVATA